MAIPRHLPPGNHHRPPCLEGSCCVGEPVECHCDAVSFTDHIFSRDGIENCNTLAVLISLDSWEERCIANHRFNLPYARSCYPTGPALKRHEGPRVLREGRVLNEGANKIAQSRTCSESREGRSVIAKRVHSRLTKYVRTNRLKYRAIVVTTGIANVHMCMQPDGVCQSHNRRKVEARAAKHTLRARNQDSSALTVGGSKRTCVSDEMTVRPPAGWLAKFIVASDSATTIASRAGRPDVATLGYAAPLKPLRRGVGKRKRGCLHVRGSQRRPC